MHSYAIPRRFLLQTASAFSLLATAVRADSWPNKPVRLIVPFPPGGPADGTARVLAEQLTPELGQSVIVENRPGAGSAIGVTVAAQARDGHTLLIGSNSMVVNPSLQPSIGYDVARDFEAVTLLSTQPLVLVVPSSSAITSVDGLIAEAKANPGKVSTGNSGYGTLAHLVSEIFAAQAGITLTPVPYKGESALLPDLVGGLVSAGFLNLPGIAAQIKSGKLRPLAVSSPQPLAALPGVPTFRALGFPAAEVQGWAVIVAPKGTIPPDGMARLEAALSKALDSAVVQDRFKALSLDVVKTNRLATEHFLRDEAERYATIIKARGIKAE